MACHDLPPLTPQSVLETLTQERLLDLSRTFGVGLGFAARSLPCGLSKIAQTKVEEALKSADDAEAAALALSELASGKANKQQNRVAAGRLVLQPGEERRRTGSHYTPRWLSEKVVKRTLEPILACLGEDRTAEQILSLEICDPAMGSGAFLVAACRLLAEELVSAWDRAGELAALTEAHGDPLLHARRLVAQRCLYGVDKNAAAVALVRLR